MLLCNNCVTIRFLCYEFAEISLKEGQKKDSDLSAWHDTPDGDTIILG